MHHCSTRSAKFDFALITRLFGPYSFSHALKGAKRARPATISDFGGGQKVVGCAQSFLKGIKAPTTCEKLFAVRTSPGKLQGSIARLGVGTLGISMGRFNIFGTNCI
jgi:hypothetical protein